MPEPARAETSPLTVANMITLARLCALFGVVLIAYFAPPWWALVNLPLLIAVFVGDGLDGYIARKRNETSHFGAMFDIACDRIVELVLWIVFADLGLIPLWVPLVFVIRGVLVDVIRSSEAYAQGIDPFSAMRSRWGQWLVASKGMRIFYAALKATTFCWLAILHPLPDALGGLYAPPWSTALEWFVALLVYASVLTCLARGAPVIVEFLGRQRHDAG